MVRQLQPLVKGFVNVVDQSYILCSMMHINVKLVSQFLLVNKEFFTMGNGM